MKKNILNKVLVACAFCGLLSCTDYLEINPESGIPEEEVWTEYDNFLKYFNGIYNAKTKVSNGDLDMNIKMAYPLWRNTWDRKYSVNALTEVCDAGRSGGAHGAKRGDGSGLGSAFMEDKKNRDQRPVFEAMFKTIRVCNQVIAHIDEVADFPTEELREDMRGQAYFIRGFAYFTLCRFWGGMPYMHDALTAADDFDMPRLSRNATYREVAKDMDLAYDCFVKAKVVRRDPLPGQQGHLADPFQDRPSGVAAKSLKAIALMYAASPLNNEKGDEDWKDAAKASSEALKLALDNGYELLPFDKWETNMYGTKYTNEQIYAWNMGQIGYNDGKLCTFIGSYMSDQRTGNGQHPTQNMVDLYENTAGDILKTDEDRAAAQAAGRYNPQNPYYLTGEPFTVPEIPDYKNNELGLDPRFYKTVIYNEKPMTWTTFWDNAMDGYEPDKKRQIKNVANIWKRIEKDGSTSYGDFMNQSKQAWIRTGYASNRVTGDMSRNNKTKVYLTDPIIRLAELYLVYAETVNEAYGPQGTVPGATLTLTPVQAVNIIRNRAYMPDLKSEFTSDPDKLRERIKNERAIEFAFEDDHYYHDTNRWKDSEKLRKNLMAMEIERLAPGFDRNVYPRGFKYSRKILDSDRQCVWEGDAMYFIPFTQSFYNQFKNFDTSLNPWW